jgi:ribosomal protein S13
MSVQYITPACINEVMSCQASEKKNIEIGMAATYFVGSDRYAMVVTEILGPKKIRVARMEDEDYNDLENYTDNKNIQILRGTRMMKYVQISEDGKSWEGIGKIYTLRKNGRWMAEGQGLWGAGSVHLGHAETYLDPCF